MGKINLPRLLSVSAVQIGFRSGLISGSKAVANKTSAVKNMEFTIATAEALRLIKSKFYSKFSASPVETVLAERAIRRLSKIPAIKRMIRPPSTP